MLGAIPRSRRDAAVPRSTAPTGGAMIALPFTVGAAPPSVSDVTGGVTVRLSVAALELSVRAVESGTMPGDSAGAAPASATAPTVGAIYPPGIPEGVLPTKV